MELDWVAIGGRLQGLRRALGLTQKTFAKRLGDFEGALISKYECAQVHPSIDQLARICAVTGESLDWLILGRADAQKVQAQSKTATERRPAARVTLVRRRTGG